MFCPGHKTNSWISKNTQKSINFCEIEDSIKTAKVIVLTHLVWLLCFFSILGLGHIEFIYIIFIVSSLFSTSLLAIYDNSFWNYDIWEEKGLLLFCMKKHIMKEWTNVLSFLPNYLWEKTNKKSELPKIQKWFIIYEKPYKKIQYARPLRPREREYIMKLMRCFKSCYLACKNYLK